MIDSANLEGKATTLYLDVEKTQVSRLIPHLNMFKLTTDVKVRILLQWLH